MGDLIEFDLNEDGSGIIHKVLERRNYLSRKAPKIKGSSYRGERLEQIIAANIDNFFIISSFGEPDFNNKVIDRFIVAGESSHIPITIVVNKSDLNEDEFVDEYLKIYSDIGYEIIESSIVTGEGIDRIKETAQGKKNIFWGHSGVGKSSLLNKMYPHLNLGTGEVSNFSNKGTHTTVTSVMLKVDENTFIIDTPGIREIDPYGIRKEDVGHYFIEFADYLNNCKFNTCTHLHEPGCAVIEAVENDDISIERYESYLRILDTIEEDINF